MSSATHQDFPQQWRRFRRHINHCVLLAGIVLITACSPRPIEDPLATLTDTRTIPRRRVAAMRILDTDPANPEYIDALKGLIYQHGYVPQDREAALNRLAEYDLDELKYIIRLHLPKMDALAWRKRLSEIIAEREWTDLSDTLVRAWARPMQWWIRDENKRPERKALVALHREEQVIDVVFDTFLNSDPIIRKGLRERAWELLHRLGQRDRLLALLKNADAKPDDTLLIDLRASAAELGIVPHNREEILWLRKLRQPRYAEFWSQAVRATALLAPARRAELELRDLPIVVAAMVYEPQLLKASKAELYQRIDKHVHSESRHIHASDFQGWGNYPQQLHKWRGKLSWGDLAAMRMAVRAMQVQPVVEHLFDFAERDRQDKSTEYGGIIRLDEQGRFEVVEFPPRIRANDRRFNAPPEMFDAGYTALFHFHNHTQKYNNQRYAGPHVGDLAYAESTRANCLVLTFIQHDTLNVDYYRHDDVIVDLGEIKQ